MARREYNIQLEMTYTQLRQLARFSKTLADQVEDEAFDTDALVSILNASSFALNLVGLFSPPVVPSVVTATAVASTVISVVSSLISDRGTAVELMLRRGESDLNNFKDAMEAQGATSIRVDCEMIEDEDNIGNTVRFVYGHCICEGLYINGTWVS